MKRLWTLFGLITTSAFGQQLPPAQVQLDSHVFLEKTVSDANGRSSVKLEEPAKVVPGDKLLFTIRYANNSGKAADNFVVTNPIPGAVEFAGDESAGAEVSVDGGKTFGRLAALKVSGADSKLRAAVPADVTHLRWKFAKPIGAGAAETLKFHAIVK